MSLAAARSKLPGGQVEARRPSTITQREDAVHDLGAIEQVRKSREVAAQQLARVALVALMAALEALLAADVDARACQHRMTERTMAGLRQSR
jgi:hypothetical protein